MTMRWANSVRDLPHQTNSAPQLSGLSRHRRRNESTDEQASSHEVESISACRHVDKRFSHQNKCARRSRRELVNSLAGGAGTTSHASAGTTLTTEAFQLDRIHQHKCAPRSHRELVNSLAGRAGTTCHASADTTLTTEAFQLDRLHQHKCAPRSLRELVNSLAGVRARR